MLRVTLYPACLCQIIHSLEKEAGQTLRQTHILTLYCVFSKWCRHCISFVSLRVLFIHFAAFSCLFAPSCDCVMFVSLVLFQGYRICLLLPLIFSQMKVHEGSVFCVFSCPPFRSICIPFLTVSDSPLSFKPSTIPQSPTAPIPPPQFHTSKVICHPCLPLINSVIGCPLIGSSFHSHICTHVHTRMHKSSY